jgi:hypothetical protein
LLIPRKAEVDRMIRSQLKIVDRFNEHSWIAFILYGEQKQAAITAMHNHRTTRHAVPECKGIFLSAGAGVLC